MAGLAPTHVRAVRVGWAGRRGVEVVGGAGGQELWPDMFKRPPGVDPGAQHDARTSLSHLALPIALAGVGEGSILPWGGLSIRQGVGKQGKPEGRGMSTASDGSHWIFDLDR
jgi:hypothetical protein